MYFLRWSRSIVTRLWKSVALLSDHWKYSNLASRISSKRGSVGRLVSNVSPPKFSSVSTVLFRIKKNHIAIYICSKSPLFFCEFMVPDLYLHLRPAVFYITELFHFLSSSCVWILPFWFSQISRIFIDSPTRVFSIICQSVGGRKTKIFLMITLD